MIDGDNIMGRARQGKKSFVKLGINQIKPPSILNLFNIYLYNFVESLMTFWYLVFSDWIFIYWTCFKMRSLVVLIRVFTDSLWKIYIEMDAEQIAAFLNLRVNWR